MKRKKNKKLPFTSGIRTKLVIFLSVVLVGGILFIVVGLDLSRNRGQVSSIDFSFELESRMDGMARDYPINSMVPYISKQDRAVAAFLVAIAKKESNWGKFSPKKDGRDCYNYWGYRGTYNQTESGYSCLDSPEQAVSVVGERIGEFVSQKIDTPKKMAVAWKCGFDCSGHSFFSVKKWEWDVGYYYDKVYH